MQHILRERVVNLPELTQYVAVYRLVETAVQIEDCVIRTLGFCVDLVDTQTDVVKDHAQVVDVTSDEEKANSWFALLWQGAVLPSTLLEVVENLVVE